MNTAPEKPNANDKSEPVTRLRQMQDQGETPSLPENPAPYITDWFLEVGPTVSTGMGEGPIGWPDMAAWQELTGIELDAWEARTIRSLSNAWAAERYRARKPTCMAPYNTFSVDSQNRVDAQFKAMVKALQARGK